MEDRHKSKAQLIEELAGLRETVSMLRDRLAEVESAEREWERQEEIYRNSERRYRSLLENMLEAVAIDELIYNDEGAIIDWIIRDVNPAYEEMMGVPREQAIGGRAVSLYGLEDAAPFLQAFAEVVSTGTPARLETTHDYSGEERSFLSSIVPLDSTTVAVVFTEFTRQKQMEKTLRESEERLRAFFEYAPAGLCLLDPDLRYLAINDTLANMNGLPAAAHLGRTFREVLPELAATREPLFRQVMTSGQPLLDVELARERRFCPGVFGHWLGSYFPVLGEVGQVVALGVVLIDITERKEAEEKLREREALLQELLRNFPKGSVNVHDREFRYIFADGRGLEQAGLSPDRLLGKTIFELYPSESVNFVLPYYQRAFEGETVEFEFSFGGHIYLMHTAPLYDEDGRIYAIIVVARDITDRKQAEEALKRSEERLKEAERVAHLGHYEIDPVNDEVVWSDETYHIFGLSPETEAPTMESYGLLVHQEDRDRVYRHLYDCFENGQPFDSVYRILRRDGQVRYIHSLGRVERNEQGLAAKMFGTIQDVTDQMEVEEALRRRLTELSALNLIAQTMTTVPDLPTALDIVAGTMTRLFDARGVIIGLLDEARTELRVLAHFEREAIASNLVDLVLSPVDDPLLREVIEKRQSVVVPQAQSDPRLAPLSGVIQARGIQCAVDTPLMVRGKVIGVIGITTDRPGRVFTFEEVKLAETIAGQVAGAVETARLFEEERRQRRIAESLREVATILNRTLDLETVLTAIFEQLSRVIPHDGGAVFLPDGDSLALTTAVGSTRDYIGHREPLSGRDPVVQIYRQKKKYVIEDISNDPNWQAWQRKAPIMSWIGVPLLIEAEAIGVLSAGSTRVGAYDQRDVRILQTFADQTAIAIRNARLYEQTQQDALIKTELLKEINHRVKNNLIAIRGLLVGERRSALAAGQPAVEAAMASLDRRIQGLADVHDILSQTQWAPVLLKELAGRIIETVLSTLPPDRRVITAVASSAIKVSPRQASHLALVINELATNTLKYGRSAGRIAVNFSEEEEFIRLEYRDDGPGYPARILRSEYFAEASPGKVEGAGSGIGLYLVRQLVTKTLRGRLSLANDGGAVAVVEFRTEDECNT